MGRETILAMFAIGVALAASAADWSTQRAEWEAFKKNFEVDYSDGSKYLKPTEGNRFAQPFAVTTPDGKPACRICYRNGSWYDHRLYNETTKKAAEELQVLVRMLTGVTLPINPTDKALAALPAIHVGKGAFFPFRIGSAEGKGAFKTIDDARLFWDDLAYLRGTDGYAIRSFGGDLYVYGIEEKGALNGVYALVENNTDIVFVRPNARYGTVFTPQTNGLSFAWGEAVRSRPASTWRGFWNLTDLRYYSANYLSATARPWTEYLPYRRCGHNVNYYAGGHAGAFDEKSTFDTHREFYGQVAGVRDRVYGNTLCFTNPDLKKTFIANVVSEMDRWIGTEMAGINFSLDDSMNWCECEACSQPIALEDGTVVKKGEPAFMSTRYFLFVNDVARALAAAHPGKKVRTLAYFQTVEPPKCGIDPNIEIEYCPYLRVDDAVPVFMPDNEIWIDRAARWHKLVGRKIPMYGYNGLGLAFPKPLAHVHQRDFREYFKYFTGINSEGPAIDDNAHEPFEKATAKARIWDAAAVEFWIMSRLYWNPDADVEQLYKKFIYRAFQEAAKPIERFYGVIRQEWMRQNVKSTIGESETVCMQRIVLKPGHENELRACLAEAKSLVRHPVSKVLVERLADVFEACIAKIHAQRNSALNVPQVVPDAAVDFDSPVWANAGVIDGFWTMPKADAPAKSPTVMRLFHDGRNLYIKGQFGEDMSRCRSTRNQLSGREEVAGSSIEIFLESPVPEDGYYLFRIDAAGNVADYRRMDGGWNRSGNCRIAVRSFETGWEVLVAVPLRELGVDLTKGNEMRAAFCRIRESSAPEAPTGMDCEYSSWRWSFFHQPNTFGTLTFQR